MLLISTNHKEIYNIGITIIITNRKDKCAKHKKCLSVLLIQRYHTIMEKPTPNSADKDEGRLPGNSSGAEKVQ